MLLRKLWIQVENFKPTRLYKLENQSLREQKEWKAYRICGILFLVMTLVLLALLS